MPLRPGEHEMGPPSGRLLLRTYRKGLAARAGHDLVIEAARWHGHVHAPADSVEQPSVVLEIDLRRLVVLEGSGGVKPLTEGDKQDIQKTMLEPLRTQDHPLATFTSTSVRVDGDRATVVGDLALAGQVHPIEVEVREIGEGAAERAVVGTAQVVQTTWGIKPYTGLLGALKLRDAVDVELSVSFGS